MEDCPLVGGETDLAQPNQENLSTGRGWKLRGGFARDSDLRTAVKRWWP